MAAPGTISDRSISSWKHPVRMFVLMLWLMPMRVLFVHGATSVGLEYRTAHACEETELLLNCGPGEVIRILRANYGRFTISVCNLDGQTDGWNLLCMSSKAKDIISERCDGRNKCTMLVSNHVFGDPCPTTTKYAEVKYACRLAPNETHPAQMSETTAELIPQQMQLNGSPRPPHITSARALNPNQIEIMWTQNEPPHPLVTSVYFQDIGLQSVPAAVYTSSRHSYILEDLRPNTSYNIFLRSINSIGTSNPSNIVTVTTLPLVLPSATGSSELSDTTTFSNILIPHPTNTSVVKSVAVSNSDDSEQSQFIITFRKILTSILSTINTDSFQNPFRAAEASESLPITAEEWTDESFETSTISTVGSTSTNPWVKETPFATDAVTERPIFISFGHFSLSPSPPPMEEPSKVNPWQSGPDGDFPLRSYHSLSSTHAPRVADNESVNGVVDKFCEETLHSGVLWPKTRFGRLVEKTCPRKLRGTATWRCLSNGWEKAGPDFSNCISQWVEQFEAELENVITGKQSSDEAAVTLNEALGDQDITPGDWKRTSLSLLPKLAQGFQRHDPLLSKPERVEKMKKFKKAFVSASSKLLSENNAKSWHVLPKQEQRQAATSMFLAMENTGFQVARLVEIGTSEVARADNLILKVNVLKPQQTERDLTFPSKEDLAGAPEWEDSTDSITISSNSLKIAGMGGTVSVVFTLYKNMEDLMQPNFGTMPTVTSSTSMNDRAKTLRDSNAVKEQQSSIIRVVNTKIISASINNTKQRRQLAEPVKFTLRHLQKSSIDALIICSFWDMDESSLSGYWSQEGCRLLDTNTTHTTCECDHLTNFAILMDIGGVKLSRENILALRVITFVGCTISVLCLMLSWITFVVFRNLQCDRNTIHKNLVFCLLVAEIVFLGGIAQTEPKILCTIVACILHYLFLSAFGWMCLEGVQLYVMLVEVFEQERSRVHWYYLFGYGVPALIVAVSAGVYHEGYGTVKHCWLTTENYFIWSFVGPVLAVMLINIGMLGIAIYIMCHHSNMSATIRERSKAAKFSVTESFSSMETFAPPKLRFPELPAWVKGAIVLVVLLGLTWLLGVLYLNEESVVVAYLFTVLNSLQGLFIFVFHCLKNEKVQKEYRKIARRTPWLPHCIRVNYGGYSGVASSSPVASSSSANYLSRLFGNRRNRNSQISTNNLVKPFFSSDQHRQSDIAESTSKVSSSLNGYMYNPSYGAGRKGSTQTPLLGAAGHRASQGSGSGHAHMENNHERMVDMDLGLSEYLDCSVVDSGFVSEYCRHNLQVSREERRYSTGSEDSETNAAAIPLNNFEVDNLSTLSLASSSRKPSSFRSSSERLDHSLGDELDKTQSENQKKEMPDPCLNLHQYIIPACRKTNNNGGMKTINLTPGADNVSSSLNKLNKPIHSLSSIPEGETSPQHSSAPNLQFKLTEPISESSTSYSLESSCIAQDTCESMSEEVKVYIDSPSSSKSSLQSLNFSKPPTEHSGYHFHTQTTH